MAKKDTIAEKPVVDASGDDQGEGEIESPAGAFVSVAAAPELLFDTGVSGLVRALVLRDCTFGRAGEVVSLDTGSAETGQAQGALDLAASAVQAAGT